MKAFKPSMALACTLSGLTLLSLPSRSQAVDFANDIQPILLKTCIECHGPEKQKGKLRLDTKADAFKEESVIMAGKAEESELYRRIILPAGDDDIMPAKGDPLTKEQADLIKEWINQGAAWPDGLVIKAPEDPNAEKDPREPIQPSEAEQKAVAQLRDLGVQIRPVAMNVTWSLANFRGIDTNKLGEAIALLPQVMTLEDLNLAGLPVQDDHLQHLAKLTNLTRLHLEKTPVTDAGLAHLKGLVNLQYLNLYNTQIGDEGLKQLHGLTRLKNLYLWQSQVTDAGAEALKAALPKTVVNRGWETQVAKAEEPKAEAAKPEEKKTEAEAKPEEKKPEEKKPEGEAKAEAKKPEEKKDN